MRWETHSAHKAVWAQLWMLDFMDGLVRMNKSSTPSKPPMPEQLYRHRYVADILNEADLLFRYDRACINARLTKTPASLSADIVLKRCMTLNWLIGMDDGWDNTSVNT